MGDRQFIEGDYVHNIILEFITDYGFVGGIGLFLLLLWQIIRKIKQSYPVSSLLLLVSIFTGIHLSLSGSYLMDTMFFIMLGLLFHPRSEKIDREKEESSL